MFEDMPFPALRADSVNTWAVPRTVSEASRATSDPNYNLMLWYLQGWNHILWAQAVNVRVPGGKTSSDGRDWAIFRMDQEWETMGEFPCGKWPQARAIRFAAMTSSFTTPMFNIHSCKISPILWYIRLTWYVDSLSLSRCVAIHFSAIIISVSTITAGSLILTNDIKWEWLVDRLEDRNMKRNHETHIKIIIHPCQSWGRKFTCNNVSWLLGFFVYRCRVGGNFIRCSQR